MRYLLFILLFLTSCIDRSGQLTIVRGQVIDELGNGAELKNLFVSSFQDNDGLFESEDPYFGSISFTTDTEGNYEFSFFNTFRSDSRGSYSLEVTTDSLYKACVSTKLELGTINEINYSVHRKAPRLRISIENLNDTTRYLIQLEDVSGRCNGTFWLDTLQVEADVTEKAFLYRTMPNQEVRVSVKIDTFELNEGYFVDAVDTLILLEEEQLNVSLPIF